MPITRKVPEGLQRIHSIKANKLLAVSDGRWLTSVFDPTYHLLAGSTQRSVVCPTANSTTHSLQLP